MEGMDIQMAPEGKRALALASLFFGAGVGLATYLIARKATDNTLNGVSTLLGDYDVQLKEGD